MVLDGEQNEYKYQITSTHTIDSVRRPGLLHPSSRYPMISAD